MKQAIFIKLMIFGLGFAAFAQPNFRSEKIAAIDSDRFFEEKTGIKEFIEEYPKIIEEQKIKQRRLKELSLQIEAVIKEAGKLQDDQALFQSKLEHINKIFREYKFYEGEIVALLKKRKIELINRLKIPDALSRFKKEKGYAIILDTSRLDTASITIEANEIPAIVTQEFIEFYNKNYATTNLQ